MRTTTKRTSDYKITVDINELSAMLSCGKDTARKIGEAAEARIDIGRRVLYSVNKVEQYIDKIAI